MRLSALLVASGVALAVPAASSAQEGRGVPEGIQTTTGVTEPDYTETISEEYRVETEHGIMYGWLERPDPEAYPDLYAQGQGSAAPGIPTIRVISPYNYDHQPVADGPHVLTR